MKTWHRNDKYVTEPGHSTDLIAREAVRWIESRAEPWFCYVPFTAVHVPVKPVQSWLNRYQLETFDEDPQKNLSFRKYAAYTSHMDQAIGELLQALERTCQRERTVVVFSSILVGLSAISLIGTISRPAIEPTKAGPTFLP